MVSLQAVCASRCAAGLLSTPKCGIAAALEQQLLSSLTPPVMLSVQTLTSVAGASRLRKRLCAHLRYSFHDSVVVGCVPLALAGPDVVEQLRACYR